MPHRHMHQAARNGVPRRNPVLFASADRIVTLDDWQTALSQNADVREVNAQAGLVADMMPTKAGDRGLQELSLLLSSSTLADFHTSLNQLPPSLRPIRSLKAMDAIRLVLMICGRPSISH